MTPERIQEETIKTLSVLAAAQAKLMESLALDYSSVYGLDPRDLGIGDHPGFYPVPPVGAGLTWLNRVKRGEFIPAFLTEQQLSIYRRRIRAMVVNNEIALNAINIHQSYAVGEGFRYEVSPRREGVPEPIVERSQAIVDAFVEHNEMGIREAELVARVLIDGEAFVRLFPQRGGVLSLRFIEPEHVYSPNGDQDHNSFGVISEPLDVEAVKGYWVIQGLPDQGSTPSPVPACEVAHFKHPETPSTSKRGLSAFFPIETTLRAAEDLLLSTVSLAKARAKIAWIRKLQGMTADVANALVASQASVTATDPATGEVANMERYRYGTVLTTNADIEMPAANVAASDHVAVMQMVLRTIAARFSMPEYMLSADASNANYSSTLVAESPFVKSMERFQGSLTRLLARNRWEGPRQSLVWRQLMYAVECGLLPRNIRSLIDVQAVGPSLVVRDIAKEAQVDEIYHGLGVKSVKTIQLEQGLDPDEESANFAEKSASVQQFATAPGTQGLPPAPGSPDPRQGPGRLLPPTGSVAGGLLQQR